MATDQDYVHISSEKAYRAICPNTYIVHASIPSKFLWHCDTEVLVSLYK